MFQRENVSVYIPEEQIRQKVKELGQRLTQEYQGKNLVIIGILKGSVVFLSDLVREIDLDVKVDFMAVSSYGSSTSTTGIVRILKDLDADLVGKDVLIVEDIVDTGLTLSYLKEILMSRDPASLKVCTFLDKPSRRKIDIRPDYNGYEIPDEFVVGYGLDYNENYRNLPYIGIYKA